MSSLIQTSLRRQFDIAAKLTRFHLQTLTTEECLWRPAPQGLHVHCRDDGSWQADWPKSEGYEVGPPSIAWVTWHIGYWWSMVLDHSFGAKSLERSSVHWPGSASGVRAWIGDLEARWLQSIAVLSDAELAADAMSRWPFSERPFADIIAWANLELAKNAAEIGYARFLYASRREHEG
jgi:hypothetical protein